MELQKYSANDEGRIYFMKLNWDGRNSWLLDADLVAIVMGYSGINSLALQLS